MADGNRTFPSRRDVLKALALGAAGAAAGAGGAVSGAVSDAGPGTSSGAGAGTAGTEAAPSTGAAAGSVRETQGETNMRTIVSEGLGRIVILGFDRGEKLREGIRDKLKELGIRNAVLLSAIGTLEKTRFHRILHTRAKPEDEVIEVDGPVELSSVEGIVVDGEPHFHMAFQDLDRAYAAHLEDGSVVCYLAEVVLAELKGVELSRVRNEHGIALIQGRPSR